MTVWATRADQVNLRGPNPHDLARSPQEPLHALQLAADVGGQVGWWRGRQVGVGWWGAQALGHVGHHGDPHGDVEPVEQVLGLRVQHPRQVADVLAAVGEERDLLIRRHAVSGEHLEQPTAAPVPPLVTSSGALCHPRAVPGGVLPDAACTPGTANPDVTQATIGSTICRAGYTATIRPPASYTDALKRQQIVAYGYPDTDPRGYEEDHLIALELGGAPSDQRNLWPEPAHSPNPKDKVENVLRQRVCAGSLTLAEAQQRIATDWTTAAR